MTLAERLTPELKEQLANTRKVLAAVPDGQNDFKPHEKSMLLNRLAGHLAELSGFAFFILTRPEINMGTPEDPRKILRMTTRDELMAEFEPLAARALEALAATSDQAFDETFTLKRKDTLIRTFPRYEAYRTMYLDHMIHHRAQLGVYLRLLNLPVPGTFGPSADEQ